MDFEYFCRVLTGCSMRPWLGERDGFYIHLVGFIAGLLVYSMFCAWLFGSQSQCHLSVPELSCPAFVRIRPIHRWPAALRRAPAARVSRVRTLPIADFDTGAPTPLSP